MPVPDQLDREITPQASSAGVAIPLMQMSGRLGLQLLPWEDTVRLKQGGPVAYKVYDELLRDARVFGSFRKRTKETTSRAYEVTPASKDAADERAARLVEAQLRRFDYDTYQRRKLSAVMKGFSVCELVWREARSQKERDTLGALILERALFRHPSAFRWTYAEMPDGRESRHLEYVGRFGRSYTTGIDLTARYPRKFVPFAWGSEYDDPYGKGLGHQVYWPVFFKREDWKLWLYYADKYGMPTVDVAYDREAVSPEDDEGKKHIAAAESAAKNIRTRAAVTHSDAFTFSLLEATRRGDVDCYESLMDYCDAEIQVALLGSTAGAMLGEKGGRTASQDERWGDIEQLAKEDARQACQSDNRTLATWIAELNVPDATPPTARRVFPENRVASHDLAVMQAVHQGMDIDYAERTYGIRIDRERVRSATPPGTAPKTGAEEREDASSEQPTENEDKSDE